MSNIYEELISGFHEERERLDLLIKSRQDIIAPVIPQAPLVVAAAAILGLGASSLLLQETQLEELSDHPLCGIPTGGKVT